MKTVAFKLQEEQHEKFKAWCAGKSLSQQKGFEWLLENRLGEDEPFFGGQVQPAVTTAASPVIEAPAEKRVEQVKIVASNSVRECSVCKQKVRKWAIGRAGEVVCPECLKI